MPVSPLISGRSDVRMSSGRHKMMLDCVWSDLPVAVGKNCRRTTAQLLQPSVVRHYELVIVLRWSCVAVCGVEGRDNSDHVRRTTSRA